MKSSNQFIFSLATILFLVACGNSNTSQNQVDQTQEQAIEIVDEEVKIPLEDDETLDKPEVDNMNVAEVDLAESPNNKTPQVVKANNPASTVSTTKKRINQSKSTEQKVIKPSESKENTVNKSKKIEAISNTDKATIDKPMDKKVVEASKDVIKPAKMDDKNLVAQQTKKAEVVSKKVDEKKADVVVAFSHDAFNAQLKKYVSTQGKVNYKAWKQNEAALNTYLKALESNAPTSSWSKNKKLAYWLNAYNAYTVKLILDNYPIKSIRDLSGGKPWDKKWIKLDGKTLSLNNIEHDIIRPTFNDARIHFAVVCAAKSCPPLWNGAFTESNVNSVLNKRTRSFINNSSMNTLNSNSVEISKIFDWYQKDFGDLTDYLSKYSSTKIADDAKISYKDYNWSLNE